MDVASEASSCGEIARQFVMPCGSTVRRAMQGCHGDSLDRVVGSWLYTAGSEQVLIVDGMALHANRQGDQPRAARTAQCADRGPRCGPLSYVVPGEFQWRMDVVSAPLLRHRVYCPVNPAQNISTEGDHMPNVTTPDAPLCPCSARICSCLAGCC